MITKKISGTIGRWEISPPARFSCLGKRIVEIKDQAHYIDSKNSRRQTALINSLIDSWRDDVYIIIRKEMPRYNKKLDFTLTAKKNKNKPLGDGTPPTRKKFKQEQEQEANVMENAVVEDVMEDGMAVPSKLSKKRKKSDDETGDDPPAPSRVTTRSCKVQSMTAKDTIYQNGACNDAGEFGTPPIKKSPITIASIYDLLGFSNCKKSVLHIVIANTLTRKRENVVDELFSFFQKNKSDSNILSLISDYISDKLRVCYYISHEDARYFLTNSDGSCGAAVACQIILVHQQLLIDSQMILPTNKFNYEDPEQTIVNIKTLTDRLQCAQNHLDYKVACTFVEDVSLFLSPYVKGSTMQRDQYASINVVDLLTQSIPKLYYSKSNKTYNSHEWDILHHCSDVDGSFKRSLSFTPSKIREALTDPMTISFKNSDYHYYFNTPDDQALKKFNEAVYNLSSKIVELFKKLNMAN